MSKRNNSLGCSAKTPTEIKKCMPAFIDLTGQRFGRLVVVKRDFSRNDTYWLCKCDCGKFNVVGRANLRNKRIKSCGCLNRDLARARTGSKNGSWVGKNIGYTGLHKRIGRIMKKPELCIFCKEKPPYDLANISQKYKHTLDDWMWLCHQCHFRYDKGWVWKDRKWFKKCVHCKKLLEVNNYNFYKYKKGARAGAWVTNSKHCCTKRHKTKHEQS